MKRLTHLLSLTSAALLSLATLSPLPADVRRIAVLLYLLAATLLAACVPQVPAGLR